MSARLEADFVQLLKEHQRLVHKVCRIYTDHPEDHEDLFQDIVMQLWHAYPQFRAEAKFSTWAYRVALNTAMTLHRKKSKQPRIDTEKEIHHLFSKADQNHDENEKIDALYQAIHLLSDIEKALIMLFLEDHSYREIGNILGISEGNARIKMMRTREKLKQLIKP
ncbi:RNA polymerase sigma factor [Riemerella columbina]|uniref:RNA polymerase sigma factor n=1 Tax=Riemerella columbina TaxID=103810 RepID=UPI0026708CD6|nr:sigma-70 family RNA polymerase sigma factor [Riemerella columbina]WKS95555.1 sigma-70 family RNA polymerase sigma factor [Riemerella columbina]